MSWEIEVRKLSVVLLLVVIAAISVVLLLRSTSSTSTGPSVRLVVDELDEEKHEKEWLRPVQERARSFLEICGFKVAEMPGHPYDATLTIKVGGKALGAFYIPDYVTYSANRQYIKSGAQIAGEISFTRKDGETWTNRFEAVVSPPSRSPKFPPGPFTSALWDSGFYRIMGDMIEKAYGVVEPFIADLQSDDFDTRLNAVKALHFIGNQRAVGPLIAVLEDPGSYSLYKEVINALQSITGHFFERDREQWSEWWKHSGSKSNNPDQDDIQ